MHCISAVCRCFWVDSAVEHRPINTRGLRYCQPTFVRFLSVSQIFLGQRDSPSSFIPACAACQCTPVDILPVSSDRGLLFSNSGGESRDCSRGEHACPLSRSCIAKNKKNMSSQLPSLSVEHLSGIRCGSCMSRYQVVWYTDQSKLCATCNVIPQWTMSVNAAGSVKAHVYDRECSCNAPAVLHTRVLQAATNA